MNQVVRVFDCAFLWSEATMTRLFLLVCVIVLSKCNVALAQTQDTAPQAANTAATAEASKNEKQVTDKEANKNPPQPVSQLSSSQSEVSADKAKTHQPIDWGDWALSPTPEYGVGIRGELEAQISRMDQSNLLENAEGVSTTSKGSNNKDSETLAMKDLKKMMAELQAMEAQVNKEIEDDTEF